MNARNESAAPHGLAVDDAAALRKRLADALELIQAMLANKGVAPAYKAACAKLLAGVSIAALRHRG